MWVLHFSHNLTHLRILQNRGVLTFKQYQKSFYRKWITETQKKKLMKSNRSFLEIFLCVSFFFGLNGKIRVYLIKKDYLL